MTSDLATLTNIDDINLRLEYVNLYKKLFNEFTIKWREEVNILNNINDIVVKEMNVCNIDSILNGEDLKVSLEGDYKSIDKYKEIFDIKKLNAEFSKQTFKEIMIATQDNNNRIKNIDKEQWWWGRLFNKSSFFLLALEKMWIRFFPIEKEIKNIIECNCKSDK